MITVAVITALAAAYLWYGFARVAPAYVARETAAFIEDCPRLAEDPRQVAANRQLEAFLSIPLALFWPLYLAGRALVGRIANAAPLTDYERQQRLDQKETALRERERHVARLERELGIDA